MTEIYCESCDRYQELYSEPFRAGLTDKLESGYLFSDQCCSVCHLLIATLRKPAGDEQMQAEHSHV